MARKQALFTVSRFAVVAAIALAGCASDTPTTSLKGAVPCDTSTCGDGQLCRAYEPHPSEPLQYSCVTVPSGCEVVDCASPDDPCSACLQELCGPLMDVQGRTLTCLGF